MIAGSGRTEIPTMRMNRRNVLLGLGTVVAGGGAALGTGAFSQIDADRTASISVASDSTALLTLSGDTTSQLIDETDETLGIDQDNINLEAKTTVDQAIDIANNGGQEVSISVSLDADTANITAAEAVDIFSFEYNESASTNTPQSNTAEVTDGQDIISDSDSGNPWVFAADDSVTLDLIIDTTGYSLSDGNTLINGMTITASST